MSIHPKSLKTAQKSPPWKSLIAGNVENERGIGLFTQSHCLGTNAGCCSELSARILQNILVVFWEESVLSIIGIKHAGMLLRASTVNLEFFQAYLRYS